MISRQIERKVFIGIIFSLILVICCGGCSSSTESSPDVSIPKYKTFVTAATFTGDIKAAGGQATGIASADYLCMNDTNTPTDGSTYKAMLVDGTVRVACGSGNYNCSDGTIGQKDWVFKPNTTYTQSDGTTPIFTTDANGVFDFGEALTNTLTNSFDISASTYYTGLLGDWTLNVEGMCLYWAKGDFGPGGIGSYGLGDQTNYSSIAGSDSCEYFRRLICVEQ